MTTATATTKRDGSPANGGRKPSVSDFEKSARIAEAKSRTLNATLNAEVTQFRLEQVRKLAQRVSGDRVGPVGGRPFREQSKPGPVRVGPSGLPRGGNLGGGGMGSVPGVSAFTGSYVAANQSRLRSSNVGVSNLASSDDHLDSFSRTTLAAISQNLLRNSPTARAILNRLARLIVGGNGFTFRASTDDPEWNKACEKFIARWSENCDARKMRSLPQLLEIWVRSAFRDGDVMPVFMAAGKLQTVESARIRSVGFSKKPLSKANQGTAQSPGPEDGNTVVDGVELDPDGAPVAYYVVNRGTDAWAGDGNVKNGGPLGTFVRIPADFAVLIANPLAEFASSTRGEPLLAATAGSIDDVEETRDATLVAIRMAANFAVLITTENPEATKESLVGSVADADGSTSGEQQKQAVLAPGSIMHLRTGEGAQQIQPSHPGPNFQEFYETIIRTICADLGISPELAMLDFSKSNFYGNRAAMVSMWISTVEPVQRCLAADLKRITMWRIALAMEDGELPYRKDFDSHSWSGPAMPAIDEMQEYKAKKFGIDANLISWSQAVKDLGGNPETLQAEIESDRKKFPDAPMSQGLTMATKGTGNGANADAGFVDAGQNAGETASQSA